MIQPGSEHAHTPPDPVAVVQEWERPMFDLALRLLRNDADAQDATQEIFIVLLRDLRRYDPTRPFQPWAYRLATNVIFNFKRSAKRRKGREEAIAVPVETSEPCRAENEDQRRLVEEHVSRLPEEQATLVVMHYYHGLSKTAIAASLDLPRTTIQSRMERAHAALRQSLQGAGALAVIPGLESVMGSTPMATVPVGLHRSLIGLAISTTSVTLATGLTIGGIVMTKKIVLTAIVLITLSTFTGYGLAVLVSEAPESTTTNEAGQSLLARDRQRLQSELEQLRLQHQELVAEAERLTAEVASARAERQSLEAELAALRSAEEPKSTQDPEDEFLDSIDWALIRECADRQAESTEPGDPVLTPEQQSAFIGELLKIAGHYQLDLADTKFHRHGKLFVRMLELALPVDERFTEKEERAILRASESIAEATKQLEFEGRTWAQLQAAERRIEHEQLLPVLEALPADYDLSRLSGAFARPLGPVEVMIFGHRDDAVATHLSHLEGLLELDRGEVERVRPLLRRHAEEVAAIPSSLERQYPNELIEWYYGIGAADYSYQPEADRLVNPEWDETQRRDYFHLQSTARLTRLEARARLHDELEGLLTVEQWGTLCKDFPLILRHVATNLPR